MKALLEEIESGQAALPQLLPMSASVGDKGKAFYSLSTDDTWYTHAILKYGPARTELDQGGGNRNSTAWCSLIAGGYR